MRFSHRYSVPSPAQDRQLLTRATAKARRSRSDVLQPSLQSAQSSAQARQLLTRATAKARRSRSDALQPSLQRAQSSAQARQLLTRATAKATQGFTPYQTYLCERNINCRLPHHSRRNRLDAQASPPTH
jgi:hypothetical protein